MANSYRLNWEGPFTLLRSGPDSCFHTGVAIKPGIYVWAFKYRDGYLIYGSGLTSRSLAEGLAEERNKFRTGKYTTIDGSSAQQGIRKELWHGMWAGYNSPAREQQRQRQLPKIAGWADEMLADMKVFLAPLPPDRRLLARVKAAILEILYQCEPPISKMLDEREPTGPHMEPKRSHEQRIVIESRAGVLLHGLPSRFDA